MGRGLERGSSKGDASSARRDLAERFEGASCPTTMRQLEGAWDGAVIGLDGWIPARPVRRLAPLLRMPRGLVRRAERAGVRPGFPWLGVDLRAEGAYDGSGTSRVWTPLGERQLSPFAMRLEASRLDGRPCVLFDYAGEGPESPLPRRHDEVRLAPEGAGLLGVSFVSWRSEPRALAWFSLTVSEGAS